MLHTHLDDNDNNPQVGTALYSLRRAFKSQEHS